MKYCDHIAVGEKNDIELHNSLAAHEDASSADLSTLISRWRVQCTIYLYVKNHNTYTGRFFYHTQIVLPILGFLVFFFFLV